ncbi:hypothetical protein CDEF62S_00696 [Castellaniella defragrans]
MVVRLPGGRGRAAAAPSLEAATPAAAQAGVAPAALATVEQPLTILYRQPRLATPGACRPEKLAAAVQERGLPVCAGARGTPIGTNALNKERFLYVVISTHSEGDTA